MVIFLQSGWLEADWHGYTFTGQNPFCDQFGSKITICGPGCWLKRRRNPGRAPAEHRTSKEETTFYLFEFEKKAQKPVSWNTASQTIQAFCCSPSTIPFHCQWNGTQRSFSSSPTA